MSEESQNEASKNPATLAVEADATPADCTQDASTMASQTNIGQVTEGPAAATDGDKWSCEVCTYENFPLSRKCTMCRSPKPCLNENIFSLQDGAAAAALPTSDLCGAEAVAERLKPLRISSPQGTAASSVPKWACATCTYENWPKAQKCAMCGAPASASASAPVSAPASAPAPKQHIGVNEVCGSQPSAEGRRPKRRNNGTNNMDWLWLQACLGVVEGEAGRVEAFLAGGGDPARALTPHEVQLLNRASAFDAGHTLVHLAIRFQRQEILSTLLSRISGGGPGLKRSPSYIAPDLATAIRRHVASCLRYSKGGLPCRYITEFCTFTLPADIEELPAAIQEQLFSELLDRDAQQTLEADPPLINWSHELALNEGCRLYALWNRSAGDCLLDAVLQAAYGVADRLGALRAALAAALRPLQPRWAASERAAAAALGYGASDGQLRADWARALHAAQQPHHALDQVHVFALAHVMRRPIVVYGVDLITSFRGEALGYAQFQGIYLPLLWEPEFCSRSPLSIGYTRGHFCALVPLEPYPRDYICREQREESEDISLLPLTDCEGKLLPVHFLAGDEMEDAEGVVRRWLSTATTASGLLVARRVLHPRPLLQAQMIEEWLNHYRRLAQQSRGPFPPRLHAHCCSDPDTDDD